MQASRDDEVCGWVLFDFVTVPLRWSGWVEKFSNLQHVICDPSLNLFCFYKIISADICIDYDLEFYEFAIPIYSLRIARMFVISSKTYHKYQLRNPFFRTSIIYNSLCHNNQILLRRDIHIDNMKNYLRKNTTFWVNLWYNYISVLRRKQSNYIVQYIWAFLPVNY